MKSSEPSALLAALLASLLAAPAAVAAENFSSHEAVLGFGGVRLNARAAMFEEYRTFPRGFLLDSYRGVVYRESFDVSVSLDRMLADDQHMALAVRRNSGWKFDVWFDRTPHRLSLDARTFYQEVSPGVFALPDAFQNAVQTAASSGVTPLLLTLANNTHPIELSLLRESYGGRLVAPLFGPFSLLVEARQERKTGRKPTGASLGFSGAIELPEPVDYLTTDYGATLLASGSGWNASIGAGRSFFNNAIHSLIWDNPRRLTDRTTANGYSGADASAQGRLQLPPDNRQDRLTATAGFDLPFHSRLTAALDHAVGIQDAPLQPWTINTAIKVGAVSAVSGTAVPVDAFAGPNEAHRGRMEITTHRYTLTSRPIEMLHLQAFFRARDQVNKSTEHAWPGQVRFDQVWGPGLIASRPFGSKTRTYGLEARVQPIRMLEGVGAWSDETIHRVFREVPETDERTLRGMLIVRPSTWATLTGEFLNAHRKMHEFELDDYRDENGVLLELPGLRRYDVADRDRRQATGSFATNVSGIRAKLSGRYQFDRYDIGAGDPTAGNSLNQAKLYGALNAVRRGGNVALSLPLSSVGMKSGSFSMQYDYDVQTRLQRSNTGAPPPVQNALDDWEVRTRDTYASVASSIAWSPFRAWTFRIDYTFTSGRGVISVYDIPSTAAIETSMPEVVSLRHEGTAETEWEVIDDVSLLVRYGQEKVDIRDWATQNISVVSGKNASGAYTPNAFFLGVTNPSYRAHTGFAGIRARW